MTRHIDSMHRDWERGAFLCYATPTGGNNSMAANGNYTCFVHFVPERNVLVFSSASCGVGKLVTL